MTIRSDKISDEQAQELMEVIAIQCEKMELDAKQILDGISKSLLGETIAVGAKE